MIDLWQEIQVAGPVGQASIIISAIGFIGAMVFLGWCWYRNREWRELKRDFKDGWLSE